MEADARAPTQTLTHARALTLKSNKQETLYIQNEGNVSYTFSDYRNGSTWTSRYNAYLCV